jgi:hypothetical protein
MGLTRMGPRSAVGGADALNGDAVCEGGEPAGLASSALVCSTSAAMRGAEVSSGNVFGLRPEVDGTGHSLVLAQIVFKEVRPESLDVW